VGPKTTRFNKPRQFARSGRWAVRDRRCGLYLHGGGGGVPWHRVFAYRIGALRQVLKARDRGRRAGYKFVASALEVSRRDRRRDSISVHPLVGGTRPRSSDRGLSGRTPQTGARVRSRGSARRTGCRVRHRSAGPIVGRAVDDKRGSPHRRRNGGRCEGRDKAIKELASRPRAAGSCAALTSPKAVPKWCVLSLVTRNLPGWA